MRLQDSGASRVSDKAPTSRKTGEKWGTPFSFSFGTSHFLFPSEDAQLKSKIPSLCVQRPAHKGEAPDRKPHTTSANMGLIVVLL